MGSDEPRTSARFGHANCTAYQEGGKVRWRGKHRPGLPRSCTVSYQAQRQDKPARQVVRRSDDGWFLTHHALGDGFAATSSASLPHPDNKTYRRRKDAKCADEQAQFGEHAIPTSDPSEKALVPIDRVARGDQEHR